MRILFWDIETAPMVVATWGLYNQNIGYDAIINDWYMISAAWRWNDSKKIESVSLLDDKERFALDYSDDFIVTKTLHEVLSGADVLVGHNGDAFDLKKFNARAIFHGFDPLPPIATVDTLKVARKHFKISSNRLDYLGTFLQCGQKVSTPKGLWMRCLQGEPSAIKQMVTYNKGDITLLEDVYDKLLPFINNHPNRNLFVDGIEIVCPKCGSDNMTKQGTRIATRLGKRQQYKCNDCGGWATGEVTERTAIR